MNKTEIHRIFFIYCIQQVEPGWFVFLNREYKPVGMHTDEWVDYHDHMVKIRYLTKSKARRMSCHSSEDTTCIYFYNDGCVPTSDSVYEKAYFMRLAILQKVKIDINAVKPEPMDVHISGLKYLQAIPVFCDLR